MAASDEPYEAIGAEAEAVETQWRQGEAVLLNEPPKFERRSRIVDWFKGVLGLFGRRAPASPA